MPGMDYAGKPPLSLQKKWPLATIIGQNNVTLRLMAMRWHLGTFPIDIDRDPLSEDRHHLLILHSMLQTPNKQVTPQHVQTVESSITHFLSQHDTQRAGGST